MRIVRLKAGEVNISSGLTVHLTFRKMRAVFDKVQVIVRKSFLQMGL